MDGLLLEIPIAENDKKILENLLTKPETSSPPLESLSETAAKVLFELAINKVSLRKIHKKTPFLNFTDVFSVLFHLLSPYP